MNVQDVLPRDAIPPVYDPAFVTAYEGDPDDEVLVVDGDPARAYPLRVLSYHEVVDDEVGGRPVAVTWCPICWSAVVYDRRVDGRTLTLGVSGKLADDTLVLYDRETGSEWKQSSGACIAGDLEGATLTALPARTTTYGAFRAAHPDGLVLRGPRADEGDFDAVYDMAPYRAYHDREGFGLHAMRGTGEPRTWDRTDVDAKAEVVGVERDGAAVGFRRERVRADGGVVTATVGDAPVVVVDTGDTVAAFFDPGFAFELADGTLRADGTTWDLLTGESADGRALDPVPTRRLFAFTWQDDHGPDAFHGH